MSGTISTRWYFPDWLSDPGLRASSLAARGLWMDLLCIAAANKGKDHGFIIIGGRIAGPAEIARMVGSTSDEVSSLLSELEQNGVFSRDRRKAIYCRRMVRAEKNRSNGRLGGNPNFVKNKENQKSVGEEPKPLIPNPVPEPKPKKVARPPSRSRLPADFAISPEMYDYAEAAGFADEKIGTMFGAFCDHHRSRGNSMADWAAAWRTWVRNEVKFNRGRPTNEANRNGTAAGKGGFSNIAARIRRDIADRSPIEDAAGHQPFDRH